MGNYTRPKSIIVDGVKAIILPSLLFCFLAACCDEKTIPSKTRQLYSESAKERNDAALALAKCGSSASSAVSRLVSLLTDENVSVQSSAAYALRKIDTPDARAALERATAKNRKR